MTHVRRELEVAGIRIAAAGVDDPHLKRDRYDTVAGTPNPVAQLKLGLTHSPEPRVLDRFADDGYDLVLMRPHARWSAVPSVLRRVGHQLPDRSIPGQGAVEVGRAHPAARLSRHRHFAVGSGALLLPPRGNSVDSGSGHQARTGARLRTQFRRVSSVGSTQLTCGFNVSRLGNVS